MKEVDREGERERGRKRERGREKEKKTSEEKAKERKIPTKSACRWYTPTCGLPLPGLASRQAQTYSVDFGKPHHVLVLDDTATQRRQRPGR